MHTHVHTKKRGVGRMAINYICFGRNEKKGKKSMKKTNKQQHILQIEKKRDV